MLTEQNWISEIMIGQIPRHSSLECLVAEVQRKNSKAVYSTFYMLKEEYLCLAKKRTKLIIFIPLLNKFELIEYLIFNLHTIIDDT